MTDNKCPHCGKDVNRFVFPPRVSVYRVPMEIHDEKTLPVGDPNYYYRHRNRETYRIPFVIVEPKE